MIEFPLSEALGPPLTHTLPYTRRRSVHTGAELGCPQESSVSAGSSRSQYLCHLQRHGQDGLRASLGCTLQKA